MEQSSEQCQCGICLNNGYSSLWDFNRQLRKVATIAQLLTFLKRKGLHGHEPYCFRALKILKKTISDERLVDQLERHQNSLQNITTDNVPSNSYAKKRKPIVVGAVNRPSAREEEESTKMIPMTSRDPIPPGKRNEIFIKIADGLSVLDFLSLARTLKFGDNEIKEMEMKYRDSRTRTMVLLELYETRKNSFNKLLSVLTFIERPDLVRQIKELMT